MAVNHERLANSSSESPGALDISRAARPTFATGGSGSRGVFRPGRAKVFLIHILRCSVRFLFLSIFLLGSSTAWCKCVTITYVITGRVLSGDGRPVSNVGLAVEWSQLDTIEHVATVSAIDGTYRLEVPFYAYSGMSTTSRADLCYAVLSKVRLLAVRGDVRKKKSVSISSETTSVNWVFN
jgi:hypothetical protein